VTKPKYATEAARKAALSEQAKKQMLAQWERQRSESGQESPGYFGCHRRVRKERGRAADQVCVNCGAQARHWAHIHNTDPADPANYLAMCISCHRRYDGIRQKQIETLGPEGRSAAARRMWERRTPERRQEIARKIAETKRRNRERAPGDLASPGI
jgi:hypothetical protein